MMTAFSVTYLINSTAVLSAAEAGSAYANTNLELVLGMLLFGMAGVGLVVGGLTVGRIARPNQPHPEKSAAYECGEPAIGDSWVQFDLRFYTVALIFIVFDVEIALLWPWAVVFKDMGAAAFWPFLVFFLLIAIPFLYEWKSGYLNWVRSSSAQQRGSSLDDSDGEAHSMASRDVTLDGSTAAQAEARGSGVAL